jgi:Gas vesicle synthesis protein GvpL/GvpF
MAAEVRCVWLYAVADDSAFAAGSAVAALAAGVGGGPVRTVSAAGLTAIVGDVDEREFGASALRRNLEDLNWLDRTARAHHAVIEAAAEHGPVVPMRLATVYSCDEKVAGMLRSRAADLHGALSRITARSELGVKAFAVEPDAAEAPAPDAPDAPDAPEEQTGPPTGPGAAYLQRRRAQLNARRSGHEQALVSAQQIHDELGRHSVAARLYPPQSPDLAGGSARMVLNAAYLVADERADEFAAAVTDLTVRHPSVRLALTGPWPAYSFAGDPDFSGEPEAAEQP